jgi:hypothetical protein
MAGHEFNLDEVWPDFNEGKTTALAHELGMSECQLVEAVAIEVLNRANSLTSRLTRHAFDVLVLVFLVSMVLVFVLVSHQSFPHGKSAQIVAVARGGIARYHVIRAEDVAVRNVPTVDNSLGQVPDVIGHYAIDQIAQNATISTKQLSSGTITPSELSGREALAVPLKIVGLVPIKLPLRVSLHFSERSTNRSRQRTLTVDDVYVISVSTGREFGIVAVKSADVPNIIELLSTSDVFVSERIY